MIAMYRASGGVHMYIDFLQKGRTTNKLNKAAEDTDGSTINSYIQRTALVVAPIFLMTPKPNQLTNQPSLKKKKI